MSAQSGEVFAATLLRVLPTDVVEQQLARMSTDQAERLRTVLTAAAGQPPAEAVDAALVEFFDLLRIADRGLTLISGMKSDPGDGAEVAPGKGGTKRAGEVPVPLEVDSISALRELPVEKLLAVLDGEPPAMTALLLTVLDPPAAGAVLKGLPADQRAEVAVRFSQPGNRNYSLIQQLARAVVEKGKRLAEQPTEAPPEARITDLAAMLRSLPRPERLALFEKMTASDPSLTDRVKEKLFNFTDLLKMDDRSVQGLLAQLNLKVIAVALKGADEAITTKVTNNISSRARELLQEEIGLLGSVSSAQVDEARQEIVTLIRQGEEEGKFTFGE